LATRLVSAEGQLEYARLLVQYNGNRAALDQHVKTIQQMLAILPSDQGRPHISEQTKREIYHLYHASRYTQEALAAQYGISQTSVQRIVTGPPPAPLYGVNTSSLG
jgi:hypothetical protein